MIDDIYIKQQQQHTNKITIKNASTASRNQITKSLSKEEGVSTTDVGELFLLGEEKEEEKSNIFLRQCPTEASPSGGI